LKTITLAMALALMATGCGSSHHNEGAAQPKKSQSSKACDPADDSCIPADNASSSPIAVPEAKVRQPMALQLPTSNGTAQVQFTLTGLKIKARGVDDKPGTKELCFSFKLRNTGTLSWKADDTTAGIDWKWFGLDGQQADTDPGTFGMCDELGQQFSGLDQPAPLPGKYVTGYYGFTVPSKPGAVEVTDSQGSPLFRLNYGPQSNKVQIDARGQ
jgi:hypothetical protein